MSASASATPTRSHESLLAAATAGLTRVPLTITLTLFAALLSTSPEAALAAEFDRAALQCGQLWRVSTGHFVHWNVDHLLWDLAAFFVLGAYCEARGRRSYAICLLLASLTISAGVWWFLPDLRTYRGLSGLDSALFVLAAGRFAVDARRQGDAVAAKCAYAALIGFLLKIAYETATGVTLFVDSAAADFVPLPSSHLLGGLAGAAVVLWVNGRRSDLGRNLAAVHGRSHEPTS
jgi:rhomboid family GlyGly-CTERM serine protease